MESKDRKSEKDLSLKTPSNTKSDVVPNSLEDDLKAVDKESRVSKKLSELTTKRVIILVLSLLFLMPLFSADYYFDPPKSIEFSLYNLKAAINSGATQDTIKKLIN